MGEHLLPLCQGPDRLALFTRPGPRNRVLYIGLREPELGQLCTTRAIGTVDTNRPFSVVTSKHSVASTAAVTAVGMVNWFLEVSLANTIIPHAVNSS